MHLPPLIQDLAVILGVAGLMSLLFNRIRQPVVLGYLIAGMIVGPYTPPFQLVTDVPSIRTWAELGVIFLMFSLGLEFSFRKLARVGLSAGVTAGTEVLFFLPVGFGIGRLFGWSPMDSIFLGAMLAISSTTIIIKALEELKLKTRRFAELIFGALIVEDLIAILLLVGLTTLATSETVSGLALLSAAIRLILVVGGWFIVGYFVIPRFVKYVGRVGNNEMLTLLSLGLCLGLVVFATRFHYSAALGAFIMGSILAETPQLHRIEARMESLRDLFGAVFFVSIGMLIDPRTLWEYRVEVAILCGVTIVGKILSTSFGALLSGQTFRNSVQVGFGLAQIGEFSFIIASLGMSLQATSEFIYPIAVAVSLVTTFTTPYLIQISGPVAGWLEGRLPAGVRNLLERYSAWAQERGSTIGRTHDFQPRVLRWLVNGLIVSIIFVLCYELLLPQIRSLEPSPFGAPEGWLPALVWLLAVLLSSPFIWGMVNAFRKIGRGGVSQIFRLLTLVWISALSIEFFPARTVGLVVVLILALGLVLRMKRLEHYYHWLERHFVSTFENQPGDGPARATSQLAPWDAHLVGIKIHPNSIFAGKKLSESHLRNQHGLNVVAVQRGQETHVSPSPDFQLFPLDELLVLGTDENIEQTRPLLEGPSGQQAQVPEIKGYELRKIKISEKRHWPVGTSIRHTGLRERHNTMVVGVERNQSRIINPDSDFVIQEGDTLWLVGPRRDLRRLDTREAFPSPS